MALYTSHAVFSLCLVLLWWAVEQAKLGKFVDQYDPPFQLERDDKHQWAVERGYMPANRAA